MSRHSRFVGAAIHFVVIGVLVLASLVAPPQVGSPLTLPVSVLEDDMQHNQVLLAAQPRVAVACDGNPAVPGATGHPVAGQTLPDANGVPGEVPAWITVPCTGSGTVTLQQHPPPSTDPTVVVIFYSML